jgi:hypothetical protein
LISNIHQYPNPYNPENYKPENGYVFDKRQAKIYYSMKLIDYLNGKRDRSKDTVDISEYAKSLFNAHRKNDPLDAIRADEGAGYKDPADEWGKIDYKTGIAWIDNITLKIDTDRPLTHYEQSVLNNLRLQLADSPTYKDAEGNLCNYIDIYLDADGYLRNHHLDNAKELIAGRDKMNAEFESQLAAQGITLTSKDKFSITVNFDNAITINGHADKERGKEIEDALNNLGTDFAYKLALHIREYTNQTMPNTHAEHSRYWANSQLEKYIGYSIDQLTVKDDEVFTKDGQKVTDILYEAILKQNPIESEYQNHPEYLGNISTQLKSILNVVKHPMTQNAGNTCSYTIEYRNNSLHDINTTLGYGVDQRGWYDELLPLRGNTEKLNLHMDKIGVSKPLYHYVKSYEAALIRIENNGKVTYLKSYISYDSANDSHDVRHVPLN